MINAKWALVLRGKGIVAEECKVPAFILLGVKTISLQLSR